MTMIVHAKLEKETQVKLYSESVNCSGFPEHVIFKVDKNETAMEACTGNSVKNWFYRLAQFRRIGYVAKKDKIKGKMTE